MATRDEIADFLEDAGTGVVGTSLFKGSLPPDGPDEAGVVTDAGGVRPTYVLGSSGIATEQPKLQIRYRGAKDDYATPRSRAEIAYRAIAGIANLAINGTRYISGTPVQPPFVIDRDKRGRYEIGFNAEFEKVLS